MYVYILYTDLCLISRIEICFDSGTDVVTYPVQFFTV